MAKRRCKVENCISPVQARGMCPKHYEAVRKEGKLEEHARKSKRGRPAGPQPGHHMPGLLPVIENPTKEYVGRQTIYAVSWILANPDAPQAERNNALRIGAQWVGEVGSDDMDKEFEKLRKQVFGDSGA